MHSPGSWPTLCDCRSDGCESCVVKNTYLCHAMCNVSGESSDGDYDAFFAPDACRHCCIQGLQFNLRSSCILGQLCVVHSSAAPGFSRLLVAPTNAEPCGDASGVANWAGADFQNPSRSATNVPWSADEVKFSFGVPLAGTPGFYRLCWGLPEASWASKTLAWLGVAMVSLVTQICVRVSVHCDVS